MGKCNKQCCKKSKKKEQSTFEAFFANLSCTDRYEDMIDHGSYSHNLTSNVPPAPLAV